MIACDITEKLEYLSFDVGEIDEVVLKRLVIPRQWDHDVPEDLLVADARLDSAGSCSRHGEGDHVIKRTLVSIPQVVRMEREPCLVSQVDHN